MIHRYIPTNESVKNRIIFTRIIITKVTQSGECILLEQSEICSTTDFG